MNEFGLFVQLKRAEKGWSQRELAQTSGLSEAAMSLIERGKRLNLRDDTVRRLARALGLDAQKLLAFMNGRLDVAGVG